MNSIEETGGTVDWDKLV